ncbi:hypothetical protein N7492_007220 [Penicillium capsulatum]|uniref:Mg2+ transporter protein, CorA-like/Zinc transport protein ZntB n=1 Tax=Penicillium capsulatum TaxID=69766 RepID=A0A9W9HZF8_9EURO|nr:hypothetical protein N7492_007220 [Penicillium capsulatum]
MQRLDDDKLYYMPPPYVLEAAKSQIDNEDAETQHAKEKDIHRSTENGTQAAAGKRTQPIFRWAITKDTPKIDWDGKYDPYNIRINRDRQMKKVPPQIELSTADDPTPTQRMKSVLAHIHREILFSPDTRSSKNYNSLPLKTKSDVDRGIVRLRESQEVNSHILALFSSFARHVGYILDYFIDKKYDCIVKGKVWAAVHGLVMSATSTSSSDALFTFHCEIFSIPFRKVMSQIEELRDGLSGDEEYYITHSMVKAFIQIVLLLADSAFEASRLLKSTDTEGESPEANEDRTENEPKDPAACPDFLDPSVYANTKPGPSMRAIGRRDVRADRCEEDDPFQLEARNRPSKALLMDINLLREELKIITSNLSQQYELVNDLCKEYDAEDKATWEIEIDDNTCSSCFESLYSTTNEGDFVVNMATRKKLKEIQQNLLDRRDVFEELSTRVDIQRVDIIQEDHGKAILVFTIVSTIFLPLSFVSSYMGMNTSDIRDMEPSQALFWQAATPFTVVVVATVLVVAYNIHRIQRWLPRGPAVP